MNTETVSPPILDYELAAWRASVGNRKLQQAVVDTEVLRRFALAAGLEADVERRIPILAHWALFLDAVPGDRIGSDGHPLRGDFLPAVRLPRRMFASAHLDFHEPLQLGQPAQCLSTVTAVTHKRGQAGDLVFVNVQREVTQNEHNCVSEQQTIVYRAAGGSIEPVRECELRLPAHDSWQPGPVDLFRFSAVTFNSHRIHYDRPYAQKEEGYPDLVVHGPFTAIKLLDYACRITQRSARSFAFRGIAPVFVSQPIGLSAGEQPGVFVATRCDGTSSMTAQIEFV